MVRLGYTCVVPLGYARMIFSGSGSGSGSDSGSKQDLGVPARTYA
jgi:hypothetical protein